MRQPLTNVSLSPLQRKSNFSKLAATAARLNNHNNNVAAALQTVNTPDFSRFFHASTRVEASAAVPAISDTEVKDLFSLWNDALATLNPDTVAQRYATKTVLLPTVSDLPRTDYEGIKSYFVDFLQKKPQGVILESNVIQGDDWCMDAGIYEFTMGATGDKVKARYTYVYTYEDNEWKIAHHHSSVMPESVL